VGNREASKALWAKCKACGHTWAVAYYPMSLETFAKIVQKHADCPRCDGPGLVAKQAEGVLLEDLVQCPGCDVPITTSNAGGYRTYCEPCVEAMPPLPEDVAYEMVGRYPEFRWERRHD
jgi:hypothetical protein